MVDSERQNMKLYQLYSEDNIHIHIYIYIYIYIYINIYYYNIYYILIIARIITLVFRVKVINSEQTAEYIYIQSTYSLNIFWYSEYIKYTSD